MRQNYNLNMITMQYSENIISEIGFDSVIEHNIFEILPANIEESHQFCRYWNATAAIQRISRAVNHCPADLRWSYSSMTSSIILAPNLKPFWKIRQSVVIWCSRTASV